MVPIEIKLNQCILFNPNSRDRGGGNEGQRGRREDQHVCQLRKALGENDRLAVGANRVSRVQMPSSCWLDGARRYVSVRATQGGEHLVS